VVTRESIRESGQGRVGDLLLEQPNINPATNAQNSSGTLFLAGQVRADIRGLGPTRTLVLMDGRRLPFSDASSPAVDLNTIPRLMIERIETIAGGASAGVRLGSHLRRRQLHHEEEAGGPRARPAGPASPKEATAKPAATASTTAASPLRRQAVVSIGGEYASEDKIMQRDRKELNPGIRRDTPLTPQPSILTARQHRADGDLPAARRRSGAARAVTLDYRNPTNVVRLSAACSTPTVQPDCQDEALFYSGVAYNANQAKSDRAVLRSYVDYQITESWHAWAEGSYVKANGYGIFQPAFSSAAGGGTMPVVLRGDNAFLNGGGATAARCGPNGPPPARPSSAPRPPRSANSGRSSAAAM
jgi:hypothetical protein